MNTVIFNGTTYNVVHYYSGGLDARLELDGISTILVYDLKTNVEAHLASKNPIEIKQGDYIVKTYTFDKLTEIALNISTGYVELFVASDAPVKTYNDQEALYILTHEHPSIEEAREYRDSLTTMFDSADDETAGANAWAYDEWAPGVAYTAGNKRVYLGVLYKCLQPHTSQDTWTPDAAPSLWAKVINEDPEGDYPVWQQPDSTNPYMIGDIVWYPERDTDLWESVIDNNVWSPSTYPSGWRKVADK